MNKTEIQKRITKNGVAISLDDFCWDEKSKTISTSASGYIFDFENMSGCTIKTGRDCTIKTVSNCTIDAGLNCTIDAGWDCTIDAGPSCTIKTGLNCTIDAELGCTIKAGSYCTINAGSDCTIKAGSYCTIKAGSDCTIKAGSDCTINAGIACTINAGIACTIKAGSDCTIKAGENCAVVRRDIFEAITLTNLENHICLCPRGIPGYLRDGIYSVTGKPAIIADGILSEIVSKRRNIYKVINHGESEISYLIEKEGVFSHGKTVKEAKDSLIYKITDRDTGIYNNYNLDSVLSTEDAIKMYRIITGACETGTKYFVSRLPNVPKSLTVTELIALTEGQYNHNLLVDFFKEEKVSG